MRTTTAYEGAVAGREKRENFAEPGKGDNIAPEKKKIGISMIEKETRIFTTWLQDHHRRCGVPCTVSAVDDLVKLNLLIGLINKEILVIFRPESPHYHKHRDACGDPEAIVFLPTEC